MSEWQHRVFLAATGVLVCLIAFVPSVAVPVLLVALAFPFLCVIAMRLAAIWVFAIEPEQETAKSDHPAASETDLPRYTLIIPLFREAQMVPGLIAALDAIDYPKDRLDILFALEAIDFDTIDALACAQLEPHIRVIVVPDGKPRTKPRAANYALTYARGDYVVVYDAEDLPEPGQLRLAVAGFRDGPENLGCLQARLNVDNQNQSWFTRQFTIEYSALFDCLLPMLQHFRLPIPLGGTSNHFPRHVLEGVGGWDPYNVTEDADLGIRLARTGLEVAILPSTTWEEAPVTFSVWLGQRTRWLKGWMQTYLVHMRSPARLLHDLGARRFAGLQVLMGGMILSALVHPWFYVLVVLEYFSPSGLTRPLFDAHPWLAAVGIANLVAGYVATMLLGALAVARRNRMNLIAHCLLMPVYWLAISYAAYRAIYQLAIAPHYWEKTTHAAHAGARKPMREPAQAE